MFDFFDQEDYEDLISTNNYNYNSPPNTWNNQEPFSFMQMQDGGSVPQYDYTTLYTDFPPADTSSPLLSDIWNLPQGNIWQDFNLNSSPMLDTVFNQPQQTNWEPVQQQQDVNWQPYVMPQLPQIESTLYQTPDYSQYNEQPVKEESPSQLNTILDGINRFGNTATSLLPLLFLGSGLMSSRAAGNMAGTMSDIAQREQQKEDENQRLLREFLASGFSPNMPDPSEYQQGNQINWTPTDVLARYRAANDDPRYGLQSYMDAEGGMRAEAAARKAAKSGRTGLNALSNLMAMRDYLANGRKVNLENLRNEAQIAAQQDQALLQAAMQQSNTAANYNAQRYNTDSQRYTSQLNNMYNAANNSNAAAAAIAAAQAGGQQYNPIMNALAQWLGRRNG